MNDCKSIRATPHPAVGAWARSQAFASPAGTERLAGVKCQESGHWPCSSPPRSETTAAAPTTRTIPKTPVTRCRSFLQHLETVIFQHQDSVIFQHQKRSFFNTTPSNQARNSHHRQDSAQRSRKKKGCWLFWDSYTHLGAHTIFYIYMLFIC